MGGHHLANMISTDEKFNTRINFNEYNDLKINAHINDQNIGQLHPHNQDYVEENISILSNKSNVFNCHLGSYLQFKSRGLLSKFSNISYCLIEFPQNLKLDSLFRKRAVLHKDGAYSDYDYYYNEFKVHHNRDIIEKIVGFPLISVPSDYIFVEDSKNYVELINKELKLNLNYNLIQNLHKKWFQTVLDSVENVQSLSISSNIIYGKSA
jgi:hypothetical protein